MRTRNSIAFAAALTLLGCLGLFALLLCACSSDPRPDDPAAPQVRLKAALKAELYGSVRLTVSGHDFRTIVTEMHQEQDSWVADIAIPPGVARRFLVEIFSAGGTLLYRGETVVDVLPEPILNLDLEVEAVATLMAVTPHLVTATMDSPFTVTAGIHGLPNLKRVVFRGEIVADHETEWAYPISDGDLMRPPSLPPAFNWGEGDGFIFVDCAECFEPVDIYQGGDFASLAVVDFYTFDNWGPSGQEFVIKIYLVEAEDFDGNTFTSEDIYMDQASVTMNVPPVRDTVSQGAGDQRGKAITSDLAGGYMVAGSNVTPGGPVDPFMGRATSFGLIPALDGVLVGYTWSWYRGETTGILPAGDGLYLICQNTAQEGPQGRVVLSSAMGETFASDLWPWQSTANDITAHGDGQFAVVGTYYSEGPVKYRDPYIMIGVYNALGVLVGDYLRMNDFWNTYTGAFEGYGIVSLGAEGFAVTGTAVVEGLNGNDLYLARVDQLGAMLWERLYGGLGSEIGLDLVQTADGGFVAVGSTSTIGAGSQDVLLIKYDASGNERWTRTFGGTGRDEGLALAVLSDGGFLIVGESSSFSDGDLDAYFIRTTANGSRVWQRTLGGPLADSARGLTPLGGNEFAVVGYTTSADFGQDIITWKIDADDPPQPTSE